MPAEQELLIKRALEMVPLHSPTMNRQSFVLLVLAMSAVLPLSAAELKFTHHFMDRDLPANGSVGDYGLTALVDLDRDGDLDFVCGGRPSKPSQLYWFEFQGADKW